MKNYNCDLCNYTTNKKSHYDKHLTTIKHTNKIINNCPENNIIFNKETKNRKNNKIPNDKKIKKNKVTGNEIILENENILLENHNLKTKCNYLETKYKEAIEIIEINNDNNKIIIETLEQLKIANEAAIINKQQIVTKEDMDILRQEIKEKRVQDNNNLFQANFNLNQIINIYCDNAIPLTQPNCFDLYSDYIVNKYKIDVSKYTNKNICTYDENCPGNCNKEYMCPKKSKIAKEIIKCNNNNSKIKSCADLISSIIVHNYVKSNKQEQSIWNTDINRLTFIIKQVIDNKNNWYDDKKGNKINTILISPLIDFFKSQINILLTQKHRKLLTYVAPYVSEILPDIIDKKNDIQGIMDTMKKTKERYKNLEQEYFDILEDLKILTEYQELLANKRNINQENIVAICSKYNEQLVNDYFKSYANFTLKFSELKEIFEYLRDKKLVEIILKQISPSFYTNKQLLCSCLCLNKV